MLPMVRFIFCTLHLSVRRGGAKVKPLPHPAKRTGAPAESLTCGSPMVKDYYRILPTQIIEIGLPIQL